MYLKLFSLCIFVSLILCVRSQWINSWSSGQNDNSRFSTWNSNAFANSDSGKRNEPNIKLESGFSNSHSSNKKVVSNGNKNFWGSSYSPNRPNNENSNFGNNNSEFDTAFSNKNSAWGLNQLPKKQSGGSSGNWESDAFSNNKRPSEKHLDSVTNWNDNKFSSGSFKNENLKIWGLNSNNSNVKPYNSWETNSYGDSNGNEISFTEENNSLLSDNSFKEKLNTKKNSGNNRWNSINKKKSNSNNADNISTISMSNKKLSSSNNWQSNIFKNKTNTSNNDALDSLNNNPVNSFSNQPNSNDWKVGPSREEPTNTNWEYKNFNNKPSNSWNLNQQPAITNDWESAFSNNKAPSINSEQSSSFSNEPSNFNNWESTASNRKPLKSSTSFSGSEKNNQSNTESNKKTDLSFLDNLDKNDWYFGRKSNYPNVPKVASLNIDVSELWNFNKNRGMNKDFGSNSNRRRNREAKSFNEGKQCDCMDVTLCDEENMILTKGDLGDDLRSLENFQCEHLTEVCCIKPKTGVSVRNKNESEVLINSLHCGQRRMTTDFEAFGENLAQLGEFPWNLKLFNRDTDTNCSASLIHPQMALTAAHCVEDMSFNLKLIAGLWNPKNEASQSRTVMKIILHPDYNNKNPRNDIALLVLENPFELTDNVNTICLPHTNDKWDPNQCFVAGWKLKEINEKKFEVLEKGVISFIPQYECQNILLVTDLWRGYVLHDSFVCGIEKNGKDPCMGNGGSPVVCPSKKLPNTYLQVGIVSNSLNCDIFGRPGIFTNVLKFLDWINQKAFDFGLFDEIHIRSILF